jgi:hypothetical protein
MVKHNAGLSTTDRPASCKVSRDATCKGKEDNPIFNKFASQSAADQRAVRKIKPISSTDFPYCLKVNNHQTIGNHDGS